MPHHDDKVVSDNRDLCRNLPYFYDGAFSGIYFRKTTSTGFDKLLL